MNGPPPEPVADIGLWGLGAAYLLLILPFGILLHRGVPMVGRTAVAILRMTVQLLFVGLYLQVVFNLNSVWLNLAWLAVMIGVADGTIVRACDMRLRRFVAPLFLGLVVGTLIPLLFFLGPILHRPGVLDARYMIPLGGMILGNCLRADIIGLRSFYDALRAGRKPYLHSLAQGATLNEALRPYARDALQAALAPTVATMATIGLVALPGMMTGVILGGANPLTAIQYQIAIMIAIFTGTAITVYLAIRLSTRTSFDAWGVLDTTVFRQRTGRKGR